MTGGEDLATIKNLQKMGPQTMYNQDIWVNISCAIPYYEHHQH